MLKIFMRGVGHPFKLLHAVFAAVNCVLLEAWVCCCAVTLTTAVGWPGSFLSPLAAFRRTLSSLFISTTISSLAFFSLVLLKQASVSAFNKNGRYYGVITHESGSKTLFHSHVLFAWASTGEFAFLVQEVEDAAKDGEEQQTQDDHYDDHSTALY